MNTFPLAPTYVLDNHDAFQQEDPVTASEGPITVVPDSTDNPFHTSGLYFIPQRSWLWPVPKALKAELKMALPRTAVCYGFKSQPDDDFAIYYRFLLDNIKRQRFDPREPCNEPEVLKVLKVVTAFELKELRFEHDGQVWRDRRSDGDMILAGFCPESAWRQPYFSTL